MTLRDRFGHFVRQAVAAPAEAPEVVTAAERAAVEELEDEGADFDVPETPTNLHQRLPSSARSGRIAARRRRRQGAHRQRRDREMHGRRRKRTGAG